MTTRPLGENQVHALRALVEHSGWRPGCGWIWANRSTTVRLLDSLVRRGLAVRTDVPDRYVPGRTSPRYEPTQQGREAYASGSLARRPAGPPEARRTALRTAQRRGTMEHIRSSTPDSDFEFMTQPRREDGTRLVVRISKVGGGTVGRAYEGRWHYRVRPADGRKILAEGDDLNTGTPKTHREAAEILLDFLDDVV